MRDIVMLALTCLLGTLGVLLKMVYSSLKAEVKENREAIAKVATDVMLFDAKFVGKETLGKMDADWRDKLEQNRQERREQHEEHRAQHSENQESLRRIWDALKQVVELAVLMKTAQDEIKALRDAKHDMSEMIQSHEGRLHFLEKA